jgi:NADH:ubiquinone oxidoreductase subunit 3 (subunit A)
MLQDFEFVGVLGIITVTIPIAALLLAWALRPKKPNPLKKETYESGILTIGDTWVQFKAQYYIYAIVFVIFDVEAIFLLPFAVALNQLPLYALVWAIVFIVLLFDGLLYAWRKGALHWQ